MNTRKIMIIIILIMLPRLTIRSKCDSGQCLTQTMLNDINHEYIAHVNDNELSLYTKKKKSF